MDICIVRVNLDHFETFSKDQICAIVQLYKKIPRKRRTLASQCLLAGRNDFHAEFDYRDRYRAGVLDNPLNLPQNRKNALDKMPEMLLNCQFNC